MGVPINNVTRRVVYAASGTGPYNFTFEILAAGDIAVYKDDALLTLTTDYSVTINSNGTGFVTLTATPTGATQIAIVGNRTISRTTDFVTGGDFFANTLNDELDQQTIFNQQNSEGLSRALQAPQTDPTSINMTLPRASLRAGKNLAFDSNGNPTLGDTLGTNRGNWAASVLYYVRDIVKDTSNNNIWQCITQHTSTGSQPINTNTDSAKWSLLVDAASASTSATNAAASASAAATSASNASTSATNAASSASTASTSASNAASAQSAAEAARDQTLASFDSFDDRYLGAKTSNPTLDNDGNALVAGALYFNSVTGVMNVYTGSVWVAAYVSGTDFLAKASNLSDLNNTATARTNLGLGTTDSPQFTAINVGNATDTTVTRASAGVIAVEGSNVLLASNIGASVQAYSSELQGASQGGINGFKNRIINGAMVIDQRNAGASVGTGSGNDVYTLDRWQAVYSANNKYTIQQSTTAPAGFTNSLLVTSSAATSTSAGDIYHIGQTIEGFNVADLGWGTAGAQTVTMSFWVRSSLTGTFGGAIQNSANNRSYPFTFTISAANTFEYKTITIAGDTSGTWVTNNGSGIKLRFNLGSGSTYSGTAGAWAGSDFRSATGAISVLATNGATFIVTGVGFEKGSTATSFDYRPYGTELALCQRYCYQIRSDNSSNGGATGLTGVGTGATSGGLSRCQTSIPTMRANPSMTISNISGLGTDLRAWNGNSVISVTALVGNYSSTEAVQFDADIASSYTAGTCIAVLWRDNINGGFVRLTAEL